MENNVVAVVGLDKGTGFISAVTSCYVDDSQKFAKYYRSIGYNSRVVSYEELDMMIEEERRIAEYNGILHAIGLILLLARHKATGKKNCPNDKSTQFNSHSLSFFYFLRWGYRSDQRPIPKYVMPKITK